VKTVKELVDTVNSLLADMDKATAYASAGTASKTGTLAGDAQVRSVRNQLLSSVYPGDGTSLAGFGIQTDRYGKLVLDETKLKNELAADPAKVAAAFTAGTKPGFAERVRAVSKGASDSIDGTITMAINGRKSTIDRLEDSIADWDLRLELREKTLTRQFTAMETALSNLNSQSSWLGSQLASMSSSS
jgi:flagellar hook-associated protein 2